MNCNGMMQYRSSECYWCDKYQKIDVLFYLFEKQCFLKIKITENMNYPIFTVLFRRLNDNAVSI